MIDILLATYNGEKYLRAQIKSLFLQDCQDFRVTARDDGSTDQTMQILEEYEAAYPERFHIIRDGQPTGSAKENFFRLLQYASAEYIMFCDQDDIWLPDKLNLTLQTLQTAQNEWGNVPLLVHSDLTVVNDQDQVLHPSLFALQKLDRQRRYLHQLLPQNNITGCTMLFNRALAKLIRPSGDALMHDWWIGLIAAAFGYIIVAPNRIHYRQHMANEVGAKDVKSASYFKQKLSNTGDIHQSILDTYKQAQAFGETYDDLLDAEQKELIRMFTSLGDCGKCERAGLLKKYKLYKSGFYRKIGQIIYG
ncbi:MAG: glycosyltransferase family 2 protein [Christensenella sp.]|uniref:glycosyltransferase family 2 protein n=1 Tax=Christensenella sp. TaxID=1935934 RepID=UPI002B201C87|nr:glycosyltransferase family 2 protein [Christensenella sp.]MEA5002400.1 glycosyltransferase family 2 protein [Christensenella sp.]